MPEARDGLLVVWGLLAAQPFGGMTWQVLHHLAGLRELGFDVWYVEDSDRYPLHPVTLATVDDCRDNLAYLHDQLDRIGMADRWLFRIPGTQEVVGAGDRTCLLDLYHRADAAIDVCTSQEPLPHHEVIRCRILLQTDPLPALVHLANGDPGTVWMTEQHDHHFTYATNLGHRDCLVPSTPFVWHPTLPPVHLPWWAGAGPPLRQVLTTVGQYRQVGHDLVIDGISYSWSKHDEFERVMGTARRARVPIELSLRGTADGDVEHLRTQGWLVSRAHELTEPDRYQDHIRTSWGEFTVAKTQNVHLRSGWFSDRSACYLAAGRPVITQDTGVGAALPTGEGLLTFADEDGAVAAIEEVAAAYERHAAAASEIAREYLASTKVLGEVLKRAGLL